MKLHPKESMANKQASIGDWIKRTLKEDPPRSKSLIITIFGDAIAPRIPSIWLGELIALLHPFQVNERLARTSGFRLMEEGWLESQRDGRRSRYSLTASGLHRIEHAYHRIYDPPLKSWDGNWTFVILNKAGSPVPDRVELRRELGWEGFGSLAPNIFLHPCADMTTLKEVLGRLKLTQNAAVLQAHDLQTISSCPVTRLASECWNLDSVANHYRKFLKCFEPALAVFGGPIDSQTAFIVQTLLIHSFRRVVLHDPRLPAALLPADWPGHAAYNLCREIYQLTYRPAQTYVAHHLQDAANDLSKPNELIGRRFGGLD
jgi:phenylacetic acid degradation operon negative regulatory protein